MAAQPSAASAASGADERVRELVERINALAVERAALYRQAVNGLTAEQRLRLKAINEELPALWIERRRAQAGHDDPSAVPVHRAA